jgi:hypothetical protein
MAYTGISFGARIYRAFRMMCVVLAGIRGFDGFPFKDDRFWTVCMYIGYNPILDVLHSYKMART